MEKQMTIQQQNKTEIVDVKSVATQYLSCMGLKLPENYAKQFVEIASVFGLNPFKREIYAVGYGDSWNIIVGYEVYIKRAEMTGKLDGWNCVAEGKGDDMTATFTAYRKDWSHPFVHKVLFSEAVQKKKDGKPMHLWEKMPSHMLRKVAISQGFRMCFPDEIGGIPYTADELGIEEKDLPKEKNITPLGISAKQLLELIEKNKITESWEKRARQLIEDKDEEACAKAFNEISKIINAKEKEEKDVALAFDAEIVNAAISDGNEQQEIF